MKPVMFKTAAILLSIVMVFTLLSACGSNAVEESAADVSAISETAQIIAPFVIIEADGLEITVEDTEGMSMQQLLERAGITLQKGDVLNVDFDQQFPDHITVQVLRQCTVTVSLEAEDPAANVQYTAVLVGGTVADAINAVGVSIGENQTVNFEMDQALENGMTIVITEIPEVEETEPTEPEEDEEYEDYYDDSDDTPDYEYTPEPTVPPATTPPATEPPATEPPATEPPAPTEPQRTVVSVEEYLDCDGSGHGVRVITYSDGTQEEVYF